MLILILVMGLTLLRVPLVASQETLLHSHMVDGRLPISEPTSGGWKTAIPLQVPLSTQITAPPMLLQSSVRTVIVRSLNNGSWVAFLLEWKDATKNNSTARTEDFTDGAAIQIPPPAQAPYVCMGQQDSAVNIWHWKADWQADLETVFHDVEQTYPNFYVDLYPYAVGGPPYNVPKAFPVEIRNLTLTGWAVGNPLSNPLKLSPIEDLTAIGFGTLTSNPRQNIIGRGVWRNGEWHVVFARPLQTGDPKDLSGLKVGERRSIAFAVWDGANREVDGKKSISAWLTVTIDSAGPPIIPLHLVDPVQVFAVIVLALVIAMVAFAYKKPQDGEKEAK